MGRCCQGEQQLCSGQGWGLQGLFWSGKGGYRAGKGAEPTPEGLGHGGMVGHCAEDRALWVSGEKRRGGVNPEWPGQVTGEKEGRDVQRAGGSPASMVA